MSDRRRIFDDRLYCHFVTFSCHRRRRLLVLDQPKRMLLREPNDQLDRQNARYVGFVIMPDHVHVVVSFSVEHAGYSSHPAADAAGSPAISSRLP